jgi:hypothetical protein
MTTNTLDKATTTNDSTIRIALKNFLEIQHAKDKKVRIIEELGVEHGATRIDIVVINGIMHGYEIKSDKDTLQRLPDQINAFNSVFDKITLVVGKKHLYNAINIIPDWWGIIVAKVDKSGAITFNTIRKGEINSCQDEISIAKFLWREEALRYLEKIGKADGLYSKRREFIYERLSKVCDTSTLGKIVREAIFIRGDWRSDAPLILNGG